MNNNNITFSSFVGVEMDSINNSLSFGEGRGEARRLYVTPSIEVIKNVYNEGLLTTISLGVSTTPATGGGDAKPGGEWGDTWAKSNTKDDNWGI